MRFHLPEALAQEIVSHCREEWPREACGLVAGSDGKAQAVHRGRNVSPAPETGFELDVDSLLRMLEWSDAGVGLAAIYHSHPHGPPHPSATDLALALYPDAVMLICAFSPNGSAELRGFTVRDGRVEPVAVDSGR